MVRGSHATCMASVDLLPFTGEMNDIPKFDERIK
jgi:hypothetical protein